jgi:nucleotide-binding universal stress UspA family protein
VNGIIVGLDCTPATAGALRWAVDHGTRHGLPVTGLLAWQHDTAGADIDQLIADAVGDGNDVRHRLSADPLPMALEAASRDADLVVLGAHHHHRLSDFVHATPCRELVRHARCPVAIVRERSLDDDAPVVVGLDGSGASREALRWAIADAATDDRPVVAVHAWTIAMPPFGALITAEEVDRLTCTASHDLERMVAGTVDADEPIERRSEYGPPVDVLCDSAEHAAIVVVGSCGTAAGHHVLFGSVTQAVADRALSTVVIVPPRW